MDNVPYVVHNGFLSAGVKYGFLGIFFFFGFLTSIIFHFYKLCYKDTKSWSVPLLIFGIFYILNLTQDLSFAPENQILIIIIIVLGVFTYSKKDIFKIGNVEYSNIQ